MTRVMHASQTAALQQKRVPAIFMARLDFPTTPMYVHNGVGQITFGGNTYYGVSDYGVIDIVEESLESRPADVILSLVRVPQSTIDPVINEKYHGRPMFIYYTCCNEFGQPVADPFEIWRGTMDFITFEENAEGVHYRLEGKSIMHNWNRPKVRRITDAEQQRRFPGDNAFKFLATMTLKSIFWGDRPTLIGGGGGGGGGRSPGPIRPVSPF